MSFFKFLNFSRQTAPTKRPIQNFTPAVSGEIKELLAHGSVHFAFKKKDGSLRVAHGTTKLSMIPRDKHPLGVRQTPAKQVVFFDLDIKEWRSMSSNTECFVY
jgi:hypothetical protein